MDRNRKSLIPSPRLSPRGKGRQAGRGFFDAWSYIYDFPLVQLATYRPVHNAVLGALVEADSRAILDVGCGTGQLTVRIKEALAHARVTGCDFSHGMLRHAATRSRWINWVQGDAGRLPFGDGVFDVVVSTEAFHWFPDQPAALAEIRRVLAPGGRLHLAVVNPPVAAVSAIFHAGSRVIGRPFYWPTSRQLREQLVAAGFDVQHQRRVFRVAGFLLPPVLTSAAKPATRATIVAGRRTPLANGSFSARGRRSGPRGPARARARST